MRRGAAAALLLSALAGACGRESQAPAPAATPGPGRIRPLTSREGSAPPSFAPEPAATLPPGHPPIEGGAARPAPVVGEAVSGTITLAPRLRDRHAPTDALFIIARSASTKQVLAVRKEEGVRFPFAFQISGADAMTEGTAFVGPFEITARLSKAGDAMPAAGDIEGTAKGVAAGAKGVMITLDTVRQ